MPAPLSCSSPRRVRFNKLHCGLTLLWAMHVVLAQTPMAAAEQLKYSLRSLPSSSSSSDARCNPESVHCLTLDVSTLAEPRNAGGSRPRTLRACKCHPAEGDGPSYCFLQSDGDPGRGFGCASFLGGTDDFMILLPNKASDTAPLVFVNYGGTGNGLAPTTWEVALMPVDARVDSFSKWPIFIRS
ncbi:MAG: hypothetical protein U0136_00690 [Bdellovibrionota bacterium]